MIFLVMLSMILNVVGIVSMSFDHEEWAITAFGAAILSMMFYLLGVVNA